MKGTPQGTPLNKKPLIYRGLSDSIVTAEGFKPPTLRAEI